MDIDDQNDLANFGQSKMIEIECQQDESDGESFSASEDECDDSGEDQRDSQTLDVQMQDVSAQKTINPMRLED